MLCVATVSEEFTMTSPKINSDEMRELDKFTKFLVLKSAQIIVQSRLGEKIRTQCRPDAHGADWFNLAIHDLPDVLTEAKQALTCEISMSPLVNMCVDISLRTVEGDTMMLETWNLAVRPYECDAVKTIPNSMYNRMSLLLKSLVTATRMTPAYRLSRRQSPDSYLIAYKIYTAEPQYHSLGEGYKISDVGQMCTPLGTIKVKVAYRTKMTISPQAPEKNATIMLKSDHFAPKSKNDLNDELNSSMSQTLKVGAFVDQPIKTDLEDRLMIPDTPFSSLLEPVARHSPPRSASPPQTVVKANGDAPRSRRESECDRASLTDGNGNMTPRQLSRPESRNSSRRSSCSFVSANDDFFMVDLKTPFANNNNSTADLGTFYKECQQAPPLQEFEQIEPREAVSDLAKQLQDFELSVPKYDELLSTLCSTDTY